MGRQRPRRPSRSGALPPDRETLDATSRLATLPADERRPLLGDLGRELHPLPARRSTSASFDPVGELLDTASPRLGGLRTAVRVAARPPPETARRAGRRGARITQEPIVTLRHGRYVVPVKAEARSRVKGIVHDASGSGQTLFVEPLVAVELGNAWREAQVAEHEEIARILDELSALVAANAPALRETLDALARFDFWAAKAQLAGDMGAVRAETTDRAEIELLSARHPGLIGRVVPIDPPRRRLHGARRDRPQHRWQDRHAAHARAARVDAPGWPTFRRPPAVACPLCATSSPTSATNSRSPSRSRRSPVTCARSCGSWTRPGRARSSCSTSSAPARIRPRARRGGPARPLHRGGRAGGGHDALCRR